VVAGRLLPLEEILGTHAGNVIAMPQANVQAYYAQAWALIMFLRHGPNGGYKAGFARCLRELGTPGFHAAAEAEMAATPGRELSFGEAVFCHYISEDPERFSASFLPYVRRLGGLTVGQAGDDPSIGSTVWGAGDEALLPAARGPLAAWQCGSVGGWGPLPGG
jgi:hypothetical protein